MLADAAVAFVGLALERPRLPRGHPVQVLLAEPEADLALRRRHRVARVHEVPTRTHTRAQYTQLLCFGVRARVRLSCVASRCMSTVRVLYSYVRVMQLPPPPPLPLVRSRALSTR